MSDTGNWCLIESDPGIFNELMSGFGVDGLDCIEVYDTRSTDSFNDALGLIFLFKWDGNGQNASQPPNYTESGSIFFAKQVITNACATQALINVLLNLPPASLKLGDTLTDFKSFVSDFDSQMKGTALANCDKLRLAHNSFARPQVFEVDLNKPCKPEDIYHYVGFVPINGAVYELDGLKPNPIRVASIPEGASWLDVILPIITKRMSECTDGRFNLMALVPSRLQMYEARAAEYLINPPADKDLIGQNKYCIFAERARIAEQRSENNRRRHNYLPFIIELLKVLAENNLLTDVVHRAKERSQSVQPPTKA
ncbi:ubiquitin carboxyl terminal hydrolase isozyme [Echinococcus multilocularis]|uniref:Ubiquitin carboxyl-terminal hydrolase n=1 Tax=Echinococcus multilocularis TaxID=6211 RepID=A0A077RCZ1_ECHMU|nr:ubiquitin carboxyl terminal hydrolase isozyme [Echinococcus multilocularis]